MKLVLLPEAKTDVKETYRYIARENPRLRRESSPALTRNFGFSLNFLTSAGPACCQVRANMCCPACPT